MSDVPNPSDDGHDRVNPVADVPGRPEKQRASDPGSPGVEDPLANPVAGAGSQPAVQRASAGPAEPPVDPEVPTNSA